MEGKTLLLILGGFFTTGLYIIISTLIRSTSGIWFEERFFGLLAFLMLFLAVILGELRMLAKDKAKFPLFRYHKPIAIFATYLVFLHFIAAITDNYKWGVGLSFTQYLGFTYTDSWMILLSIGTLAFYLLLIIGMTSARKSIQLIGFKRWKLIHYLSYACFAIAYIHAINLGTDLKDSILEPFLRPIVALMFAIVTTLFLVRAINHFPVFDEQTEINLAIAFVFLIILFSSLILSQAVTNTTALGQIQQELTTDNNQLQLETLQVTALNAQLQQETLQLGGFHG